MSSPYERKFIRPLVHFAVVSTQREKKNRIKKATQLLCTYRRLLSYSGIRCSFFVVNLTFFDTYQIKAQIESEIDARHGNMKQHFDDDFCMESPKKE